MHKFPVLSVKAMHELDQKTLTHQQLTPLELLIRAGYQLTEALLKQLFLNPAEDKFLCVAGPGLNGGDAIVMADRLKTLGFEVRLFIINLASMHETSKRALASLHPDIQISSDLKTLKTWLVKSHFVIDGIFGIGLNKPVKGKYLEAIHLINARDAYLISIDIPSGIHGDNGLVLGAAIKAQRTLIVGHYKLGNVLQDAKDYQGIRTLVDIGLEPLINHKSYLVHEGYFKDLRVHRKHHTHKYDYGSVLTIGGAKGMMGAPYLASLSALKMGTGLSFTMHHKKDYQERFKLHPEIMAFPYETLDDLKAILPKQKAIVFGPGLGRHNDTNDTILKALLETTHPIIIDADGLFYLKPYLNQSPKKPIILTPHVGEMARLFEVHKEKVQDDPLYYIKKLTAKSYTVLLKGPTSILASKNKILLSAFGTPVLATAGSGDVLSGMIAALIAKGFDPFEALNFAVYIHSQAGYSAGLKLGVESVLASDIIHHIGAVLERFRKI